MRSLSQSCLALLRFVTMAATTAVIWFIVSIFVLVFVPTVTLDADNMPYNGILACTYLITCIIGILATWETSGLWRSYKRLLASQINNQYK